MKKIIILLTVLLLSSCNWDSMQIHMDGWAEAVNSSDIKLDVSVYKYNGHQYLIFGRTELTNGVVHDPDCSCMIDYE